MARLVVATVPLTGHVEPMRVVVRELVARGHEVTWYSGRAYAATIEATGARFVAASRELADISPRLRGIVRVQAQLQTLFIAPAVDQARELAAIVDREAPDGIVADAAHLGAAFVAEQRGLPWVGLGISALMTPSIDTAPFGSARRPARDGEPRWIYRLLNWLIFRVVFWRVNRAYRRARVAAGLPAGRGTYFDVMASTRFLQPTVPAFEYPRSDLPPQVEMIGPLLPRDTGAAVLPTWWGDVATARERGVPIVLVTQGTLATDPDELIAPALEALADEPVLVIATTSAALPTVPANARIAPFIPYGRLLPNVSVMVTNGGYGGVQMALAAGVPLVVAGGSEEKPEVAARVAWSGTGIDLRTGRPRASAIRRAVRRVLDERSYRERAQLLSREMARHDAPGRAADLIEEAVMPVRVRQAVAS
ncbi:MAG TPA: nucleotide disphospho-sugar-binding domain-containing protein [Kofleriaceae bacterium]|nr:nucleotide disphospho-sugar-binding domain-containing protein [Kofleriaceae bacterium]